MSEVRNPTSLQLRQGLIKRAGKVLLPFNDDDTQLKPPVDIGDTYTVWRPDKITLEIVGVEVVSRQDKLFWLLSIKEEYTR